MSDNALHGGIDAGGVLAEQVDLVGSAEGRSGNDRFLCLPEGRNLAPHAALDTCAERGEEIAA